MDVHAVAAGLAHATLVAGSPDSDLSDLTNDSRRVRPGSLYAALPGEHVDGHDFIAQAIGAGARAVLCERLPQAPAADVAWLVADNARLALSEVADRFFGSPSRELAVIGVTGTDGKTSTVYFIHQLLQAFEGDSGFLSTAAMQIGPHEQANQLHQSTPEAPEVHRALRSMLAHGARYAVLESTSHGLSRRSSRLAHVHYRAAVFTNLSHEHLEFHGSFARYRSDKANLLRALDAGCYADAREPADDELGKDPAGAPAVPRPRTAFPDVHGQRLDGPFGVVNADDENAGYFLAATEAPVVTYGFAAGADYRATDVHLTPAGSSFTICAPDGDFPCTIAIPGRFNVANTLAAVAVVRHLTGRSTADIAAEAARLRSVRGRMSVVASEPFSVVVDYAHTPGSFESVLPFFREQCSGRLLVVFGSAGERDAAKRSIQGRVADRYADVIVLADEDPRGEDPMAILREIASGAPGRTEGNDLFLIPDRRRAIRHAFESARAGDTVLLLGKGHETTIIGARETIRWDELGVAREELDRVLAKHA